ncbi:MAG: NADP-dependent oxidoreductase [Flavobacteriaceae bacterium]|jgi:NADPH-dependent curcumin reductase CurA|nr:NADP-dependent oxidoreductase [Flavobacteriaceae bacterium]MDG2314075.1 NADP-dependent oxidoreductase [Flavobacteriaceae bacterium]
MINRQYLLAKRPKGLPEKTTWKYVETSVAELQEGEMLIENHYVSLDPAMRAWMNETRSYIEPIGLGKVMRAGTVGQVIRTKGNTKFEQGTFVTGWGGVQDFTISSGNDFYQIDPGKVGLPTFVGTLGMPGMTAYFGILEVGKIKKGDVVLVSGAAGAVGSIVGQIAKIKGCKVVGIAGGKHKCAYLVNELGFDGAIDYKNESVRKAIKRECPTGIDVYFDNVGGEILDAALMFLRMHARVVVCGAISQYNETVAKGPNNYLSLLVNRASMKGMVVLDYAKNYQQAIHQMSEWMANGKLKSKEDVYEGMDQFYETFLRLFSGEKLGKLVLKIKQ